MELNREAKLHTVDMKFMDCQDLDDFVKDVFDRPYNSLHTGEYNQDEIVDVNTEEFWSEESEAEEAVTTWLGWVVPNSADWKAMRSYDEASPRPELIMEYLFNQGILPAGYYGVRMWW